MARDLDKLFSLKGKVIIITGAAGLLGEKHAEAVAAYGGNPVLLDLSEEAVKKLAVKLSKKYRIKATGYAVDITDESKIEENALLLIEKYGRIDGLVNNAANNPTVDSEYKNFTRLEDFPLEVWNKDIEVGLTGAFLCAKHYGFRMAKNSKGGSIVNISSDLGLIAPDQRLYAIPGQPEMNQPVKPITYSVIKTGMIGLTRYLATYWAEKNIRCNALCPGGVENGQTDNFLRDVSSKIPMNRLAKADEYQGTLIWMLSDASSYLNGAIVPVEGGRTAW